VNEHADIDAVLTTYAPLLGRIAASYETDSRLREDLVQDISLAVWRALERFKHESSLKTYVAKIAHNRCVDHVLKEKKHNDRLHNDVEDMDEMPTSNGLNQDTALDVTQAIQRLGITYKQVITMQLEGFSQQEIASVLGINEAAVAKRSSRARLLLEQWLKE